MVWAALGMLAIVAAMIVVGVRRGLDLRRLVNEGVATRGTIERKWRHTGAGGRSVKRLRYGFSDTQGRTYSRAILASEGEYAALEEGQPVEIVYLPTDPRVSALASMVATARMALQRQRSQP